ncbi:hypothetical protein AN1V17_26630 [Vallitalea sediminicola]
MPQYTSNMDLYKVDLETDGNSTFNIKTMLNDNWDKIDSKYDEQEGRIRGNSEVVNEVKEDVGDKSELKTEEKSSLVGAVNEVSTGMADIAKLIDKSVSNIVYYVDNNYGNDSNNGLTENTAFKTVEKAFELIPYFAIRKYTIKIKGNYNSNINLTGYKNNGYLPFIIEPLTLHSEINGQLNLRAFNSSESNGSGIVIRNFTLTETSYFTNCNCLYINNCIIKKCICFTLTNCSVIYCTFFNCNTCIKARYFSSIYSNYNQGTGEEYGLYADINSVIGKRGPQPTGNIANEFIGIGSVIK